MATRSQTSNYVQWSAANIASVATGGGLVSSDDYSWSADMVASEITVKGDSAGAASDDILDIYYSRKKNAEYDDQATFVCSVDCSSGSGIKTMNFGSAFPADVGRFSAECNGTNNITVSVYVTEDKVTL